MIKTARCTCPAHTPDGRAGAHRALNRKDPMVMVPKVWQQLSAADLLCPPAVWGHRHLGKPQPFWPRDGADTGLPRLAVSSWEGSGRGGHTAWFLSHCVADTQQRGHLGPSTRAWPGACSRGALQLPRAPQPLDQADLPSRLLRNPVRSPAGPRGASNAARLRCGTCPADHPPSTFGSPSLDD